MHTDSMNKPKKEEEEDISEDELIEDLSKPGLTIVCAQKYSGKSVLMKHLMEKLIENGTFDWGYIISQTTEVNGEWNIIPPEYIKNQWNPEDINKIYDYQKQQMKNGTPKNCFILMDDVIGLVDLKDKVIQMLVTNGRHLNIWLFIVVQKLTDVVPPVVRQNAEFFIFFQNDCKEVLEAVHQQYMSTQMPKPNWYQFCRDTLVDFTAIIINTRRQGLDKIREIQAPPPDPDDEGFFFDFTSDGPTEEAIDPLDENPEPREVNNKKKKLNVKQTKKKQLEDEELDLDEYEEPPKKPKKKTSKK